MLVDKKKFKELKKDDGGSLGFECSAVARILEAEDLKKVDTCNLSIHPKGLYMDFLLSYKLYFPLENLQEVKINDGAIEIYIDGEELIKMIIEKKEDAVRVYTTLRAHLGEDYDKIPLKDYISGNINADISQDNYCQPINHNKTHSYIITYKECDKLQKEVGLTTLDFNDVVKILEMPEFKKVSTCNLCIYPNGLYISFTLKYKLYFPMLELKNVIYDNNIVSIYLTTGGLIKIEIEKKKVLLKLDKALKKYLGDNVGEINYNEEAILEAKVARERKKIELEKMLESNEEKETKLKKEKESEDWLQQTHCEQYDSNVARCPKCGSTSITANKKGFSLAKGALGVATVGVYGAIAAGHGKNKVIVTCLKCGHQWKPGK